MHIAFRGAISRTDLRKVIAATYHQVWWPTPTRSASSQDQLPEWHEATGRYIDPATGEVLPSWDQALDAIGPADEPLHVARFGPKFDAQGVLAGTRDSGAVHRLPDQVPHQSHRRMPQPAAPRPSGTTPTGWLTRCGYEPCSPPCANWLRYGMTPKNPRAGLVPGLCKGKAHRPENLGYAGRRVLVSRKWSGKTLADHRADRKAWLLDTLGLPDPATSPGRYRWEYVTPADADHMPPTRRLLHVLADRTQQQTALDEARRRTAEATGDLSATGGGSMMTPSAVESAPRDHLWTVEELSAYLDIPVPTLYRWRRVPLRAASSQDRPPSAVYARRKSSPGSGTSHASSDAAAHGGPATHGPDGRERGKSFQAQERC